MGAMVKVIWGFAGLAAVVSSIDYVTLVGASVSAPQQAAAAAMAVAGAVIPYCFARAFEEVCGKLAPRERGSEAPGRVEPVL